MKVVNPFSSSMGDALENLLKYEELAKHTIKKVTKGKQQVLKRQFCENESCDLFSSKSLDVSQVIGNTPLSGPMQRTVETDALRQHWECSSGCGLICGDSFGKQFQSFAVYWK